MGLIGQNRVLPGEGEIRARLTQRREGWGWGCWASVSALETAGGSEKKCRGKMGLGLGREKRTPGVAGSSEARPVALGVGVWVWVGQGCCGY